MHMKGLSQWGLHSFVGAETRGTVGLCHPMAGGRVPPRPGALLVLSGPHGGRDAHHWEHRTDAPGRCEAQGAVSVNTQTNRPRSLARSTLVVRT